MGRRNPKWVQRLLPAWTGTCVDCGADAPWDWLWCERCWEANVPVWAASIRLPACERDGCTSEVNYTERWGRHRFCGPGCNQKHNAKRRREMGTVNL